MPEPPRRFNGFNRWNERVQEGNAVPSASSKQLEPRMDGSAAALERPRDGHWTARERPSGQPAPPTKGTISVLRMLPRPLERGHFCPPSGLLSTERTRMCALPQPHPKKVKCGLASIGHGFQTRNEAFTSRTRGSKGGGVKRTDSSAAGSRWPIIPKREDGPVYLIT